MSVILETLTTLTKTATADPTVFDSVLESVYSGAQNPNTLFMVTLNITGEVILSHNTSEVRILEGVEILVSPIGSSREVVPVSVIYEKPIILNRGTYSVLFKKKGYINKTVEIKVINNDLTIDVFMDIIGGFNTDFNQSFATV
jgi:hypothetical protein